MLKNILFLFFSLESQSGPASVIIESQDAPTPDSASFILKTSEFQSSFDNLPTPQEPVFEVIPGMIIGLQIISKIRSWFNIKKTIDYTQEKQIQRIFCSEKWLWKISWFLMALYTVLVKEEPLNFNFEWTLFNKKSI